MTSVNSSNPVDRKSVYLAGGMLSAFGATMYAAASPFLVALGKRFSLGESQQGDAIAAFFVGFTIVAIAISLCSRQPSWRGAGSGFIVIGTVAIAGMALVSSFHLLLALMALAGVGMGGAYTVAMTLFGSSSNPDRAMGIKLWLETLPGMVLLYLIPQLDASWGFEGPIGSICVLAVVALVATRFIPTSGLINVVSDNEKAPLLKTTKAAFRKASVLGGFACLAFIVGTFGCWSFLAQIAAIKGFAEPEAAAILSASYLAVGVGSLLAAAIGDRWGRFLPLTFGGLVCVTTLTGLGFVQTITLYGATTLTWALVGGFTLVYLVGFVAESDPTGKVVALVSAAFSSGAIIGPLSCGYILERYGPVWMCIFAASALTIAIVLYLIGRIYSRAAACEELDEIRRMSRAAPIRHVHNSEGSNLKTSSARS